VLCLCQSLCCWKRRHSRRLKLWSQNQLAIREDVELPPLKVSIINLIKRATYHCKNCLVRGNIGGNIFLVVAIEVYLVPNFLHCINSFLVIDRPGILVCCDKREICWNIDTTPSVIIKTSGGEITILPFIGVTKFGIESFLVFGLDGNIFWLEKE